jgi:GH35 family endo-1,4-beta-xylanase
VEESLPEEPKQAKAEVPVRKRSIRAKSEVRSKTQLQKKQLVNRASRRSSVSAGRDAEPKPSKRGKVMVIAAVVVLTAVSAVWFFVMRDSRVSVPAGLSSLAGARPVPEKKWPAIYSGSNIAGIEKLVEDLERSDKAWRQAANRRIDQCRMADIELWISDADGKAVPGVDIRIRQVKHQFLFGGIIRARTMFGSGSKRHKLYSDTYLAMGFNAGGLDNALKYKLRRGQERFLPRAFEWFAEHEIPVRGHCLIWPSQKHLPPRMAKLIPDGDKALLRKECNGMIAEWASKWNVFAWDVINETRGNHDVQDMLGHKVIVEWFRIARKNVVNPDCQLLLNENRVVSDNHTGILTDRMKSYRDEVRFLVENGAPITGIGLQSRFKENHDADEIYKRLSVFDEFNLPITATEFELPDGKLKAEIDKARMLEKVMTVYFSHHLVQGIFQWTIFPVEDSREIVDENGRPNLRGKMWLYLTKKHWHTDRVLTSDESGRVSLRGFKGDYIVSVNAAGKNRCFKLNLSDNVKAKVVLQ